MDLISLIYFNELVKELNFTRAAENMHTSQQCLSQHIKKLEETYGSVFFERKPRIRLTYAGELFFDASRQILEIERNLNARLSYITEEQYGTITLGLPSGRCHGFLPLIVPAFKKKCPHIMLSLVEANSHELEKLLLNGDIDVMIGSRSNDARLDHPLFQYIPLLDESLYLLASDSLLKQYYQEDFEMRKEEMKKGAYLKEFMDLPLIMDSKTSRIQEQAQYLFHQEGKRPNLCIQSSHGSSLIRLCQQGYCAIFCLQMILHATLTDHPGLKDEINIFPLLDHSLQNKVVLVHRTDMVLPKYLAEFIELTKEIFKTHFAPGI